MSGKSSRTKGHQFERDMVNRLKKFWPSVLTSRSESKRLDDKGVDLAYTDPFSFQCKAQERLTTGLHDVLASMPNDTNYNVVLWKRNRKGVVVAMTLEDFEEILQILQKEVGM